MIGDGITNTECEDAGADLHTSGTMTSNKEILVKRYWRPDSEVLEQHTVKSGARSFSSDMLLCQDHGLQPLKLRLLPILRLIGSYGADVD